MKAGHTGASQRHWSHRSILILAVCLNACANREGSTPAPGSASPLVPTAHPSDPPAAISNTTASASAEAQATAVSTPSRVEKRVFASTALGVSKQYVVYLPRGYDESSKRFPLVIMLHGLGGSETNWIAQGRLQEAADSVGLDAVVVMPDGDDGFYVNGARPVDYATCLKTPPPWSPSEKPHTYCVRTPRYEDYIVRDLVADVERTYRTERDRGARGIGGLSMGGFGALVLAMRHPKIFSVAVSHSGMASLLYRKPHPYTHAPPVLAESPEAFGGQYSRKFADHVRAIFGPDFDNWRAHEPSLLATRLEPDKLAIRLDCGRSDGYHFEDHAAYLAEVLDANGVRHELSIVPGQHVWTTWRATLPAGLRFFQSAFDR